MIDKKEKKSKRVVMNLIQAEVYANNPELLTGKVGARSSTDYYELRARVGGNAVYEELVKVPYPVTPESVSSYENSTDYKRDVESAVNSPARGTNLGDVVDMQRILSMDRIDAQKLIAELNGKYEQACAELDMSKKKKVEEASK